MEIIKELKSKSQPKDRCTSFDHCYNYFLTIEDTTKDIEKSCLVLEFYLASWGMLRDSSFLLQKNAKHFQPTIEYIATLNRDIWKIDVDKYNEQTIEKIIEIFIEK